MHKTTKQMKAWSQEFGRDYTERNLSTPEVMDIRIRENIGFTRTEINVEFLGDLDRSIRILEVGTNVGTQLMLLQNIGFTELYGIELQHFALEIAQSRTQNMHLFHGSIFEIPFEDNCFDLVFTSTVLIHIHPDDIRAAMSEIYRCTKKYIWGYEFFSEGCEKVVYHGKEELLWKADFARLYQSFFPGLGLIKEKRYPYLNQDLVDSMFLLSKS